MNDARPYVALVARSAARCFCGVCGRAPLTRSPAFAPRPSVG